jgi:hypothetical protein
MENQVQVTPQMLKTASDVACEECGSTRFKPVALLKRVSPLMAPGGRETVVPLQSFACDACGHMNEEFLPKFE